MDLERRINPSQLVVVTAIDDSQRTAVRLRDDDRFILDASGMMYVARGSVPETDRRYAVAGIAERLQAELDREAQVAQQMRSMPSRSRQRTTVSAGRAASLIGTDGKTYDMCSVFYTSAYIDVRHVRSVERRVFPSAWRDLEGLREYLGVPPPKPLPRAPRPFEHMWEGPR